MIVKSLKFNFLAIEFAKFCLKNQFNVVMTSTKCLTGTDRVFEVSNKIKKDFYINVQGDEPLVSPIDILRCIDHKIKYKDHIINSESFHLLFSLEAESNDNKQ